MARDVVRVPTEPKNDYGSLLQAKRALLVSVAMVLVWPARGRVDIVKHISAHAHAIGIALQRAAGVGSASLRTAKKKKRKPGE